jgi:hypothetical protein
MASYNIQTPAILEYTNKHHDTSEYTDIGGCTIMNTSTAHKITQQNYCSQNVNTEFRSPNYRENNLYMEHIISIKENLSQLLTAVTLTGSPYGRPQRLRGGVEI